MNWYALYTKSGKEDMVAEMLGRAGISTYVPRLRIKKFLRGQYRNVVEPLFPSYMFARFDALSHLWMVSYTRGVRKVVGSGGVPWSVPKDMVELFRSRETDGLITMELEEVNVGDTVRITDGPFAGLLAVLQRPLKGAERALLLLKAIEYQAQVYVERSSILKAD